MTVHPHSGETALKVLGATIRLFRERHGLTQNQLAARTGFKATYISSIERGERNVSMRNFLRLAAALGVKPSELLQPLDSRPELYPGNRLDES